MNEFYSYLSDTDKEFMAIETAFDIEMEKQMLAYEYATKIFDIKMMQSDLKVLTESGTYEDIETLYMEAGKEAEEKQKGVIGRMIDAIVSFISGIFEKIGGLFKGKKEKDVEDDIKSGKIKNFKGQDPSKKQGIFSKAINQFKGLLKPGGEVSEETGNKALKIAGEVSAAIAALGTGTVIAKSAWNAHKNNTKMMDEMKNIFTNLKKNLPKGPGVPNLLKGAQQMLTYMGSNIVNNVKNFFKPPVDEGNGTEKPDVPTGDGRKVDQYDETNTDKIQNPAKEYNDIEERTHDFVDGDGFMESEELQSDINEITELFASL